MSGKLDQVIERWLTDEAFREELRRDRVGAIDRAGFVLDAEEWDAVGQLSVEPVGAALQPRISKFPPIRTH